MGRQLHTEAGPLDLLGIDPQGRWILIEIKRGAVRRDTITQAVDYASCVATMPFSTLEERVNTYLSARSQPEKVTTLKSILAERLGSEEISDERDVDIIVVGTGRDRGMDRMVDFLNARCEMTVSVVAFEVFEVGSGERVLVRELTESDSSPQVSPRDDRFTIDRLLQQAGTLGGGQDLKNIMETGERVGLHPRIYKYSIMFAPPTDRRRCLFVVWANRNDEGHIKMYVAADTIQEFYGIAPERVREHLGVSGDVHLSQEAVARFTQGLEALFAEMRAGE